MGAVPKLLNRWYIWISKGYGMGTGFRSWGIGFGVFVK